MKKVLVILLLFSEFAFSQSLQLGPEPMCGDNLPVNYGNWRKGVLNNTQNMVSTLAHDTCLNKKFSIAFHLVCDSTGYSGVSPGVMSGYITALNDVFKRICVSFANCHVDSIPNYSYNDWIKPSTDAVVSPNWDLDKTINIYMADSIRGFPAGYAYGPGGKDVIVIEKGAGSGTVIHEMGHFFGLPHTWDEISPSPPAIPAPTNPSVTSQEFVARIASNCYTHGDGFCDTEADCYDAGYDKLASPCTFVPGAVDGMGNYYVPPVDNYMTYFKNCRCRFTQEQYNFMARVILTQRLYLH